MKNFSTLYQAALLLAAVSAGTFTSMAEYSGVGTFNKIGSVDELTSGTYVIIANNKAMSAELGGNKKFVPVDLDMTGNKTSIVNPAANLTFDFTVAGDGVITIKNGENIVGYASGTNFSFNNTPNTDATKDQWKAEYNEGFILTNVNSGRCILLNNTPNTSTGGTNNAFGPYAASNVGANGYYTPNLFKLSESGLASPELAFVNGGSRTEIFRAGFTFDSKATSKSTSPIIYSSSNTDVATIDNNGTVTLKGAGETVIKAEVAATDTYDGAAVSYTLNVLNNSVYMPYSIDFKSGLGDWLNYSVNGKTEWYSDSKYGAVANGHNKGESETWLISPVIEAESMEMTFSSWTKYTGTAGTGLFLLISSDFNPFTMDDPNSATWTDITSEATWSAEGSGEWVESGTIKRTSLEAPIRVAFKYTCGESAAQWEITDFAVTSENSGVIDEVASTDMKIVNGKGEIVVISDKAAEIAVYNMTGMVVLKAQIAEGNNTISLPAGIYIVNGMKTIVF